MEPLNLLDLPIDILHLILTPLLTTSQPILVCPCASPPLPLHAALPILLTHPALYAVACPLLYSPLNTFLLDLTGPHCSHVRRAVRDDKDGGGGDDASSLFPSAALRRIAGLTIRTAKLRGWILGDVLPLVSDMAVRGSLVSLDVELAVPADKGGVVAAAALQARPLLSLLADPYLRSSRLCVDERHSPAWCRFHPGQRCTGRMRSVSADAAAAAAAAAAADTRMVDVDWREIVREMDPEGRELAMGWADGEAARRR
ncbi:hypothetical protein B0I35DRAFT_408259 [Stachybotrys elegans]|uniref:Uncharacterized protein n=1 Tax=Stachybotrys elegans TaxID=80388 RepID=A0A8K0SW71_9HYPO|nr:hypothetical protein B0I35DRAFT_408259 [Stachybotrys elegans]